MKPVFVTTSWDDGHKLDLRLAELLKKYAIKGTFYVAPKDNESNSEDRLTDAEIKTLSLSFELGAHTMTHARLTKISNSEAEQEINDSKHYLEKITGQPVVAFCYPRGEYRKKHVAMVKKAGFLYARTVKRNETSFDEVPLEARTTVNTYNHYSDLWNIACFARFNPLKIINYFQWDNLAKARFDQVLKNGGQFHLWGHSWEIKQHGDWEKLESVLAYISYKQNANYMINSELITKKPKRVLIATPYFPPHLGGTQLYALNIAKRLQDNYGWYTCIATSGDRGFRMKIETYDGLTVYRLPYWLKISNTPVNPMWFFMIKKILRHEDISTVNAHGPVPFMSDMAAMASGKRPFILTYHGGTMRKNKRLPDILIWLYENGPFQKLLHRANSIICSSDFVRFEFLQKYFYKSTTITPAVDTNRFNPSEKKTEHPTILFVAGLTRSEQYKGLKVLVAAFQIVRKTTPDLRLVIVGDGNMRPDYEAWIKSLGLEKNVTFKGKLFNNDLVEAYQDSDIFVLPSLAPAESFGMVLIEAMASGKPVIGSRAGGIPGVIDDEKNGLLTDPGDIEGLASSIKRLLDDPTFAKKLGEAGREKTCREYNWDTQARRYNDILEKIPNERSPIVQLVGYYPPHIGGMEVVAQEISMELARQRYRVKVITSAIGAKNIVNNNTEVRCEVERLSGFEIAHTPILWSLPLALLALPKKSILHVHISQAGIPEVSFLIAKLRGFPYVAHFHLDVGPSGSFGKLLPFYKKYLLGPVLRGANKVIVFSEEQSKAVREIYKIKESNLVIIPNGVGEAFFKKAKTADKGDYLRILYVGRLSVQKRVDRLINAMAHLTVPAHLMIVGDGEDRKKLEGLVKRLELTNVSFEGKKYGNELLEYYENANVFAISSDIEGMPLVVLEAMAAGLPIIGSSVPGIYELIKDAGILVNEPYPEKFAEAFNRISENPQELKKLSLQSSEIAKQYSWKKLVEKLTKVYDEIIE